MIPTLTTTGRWAIELTEESRVIGGVTLFYLPPGGTDLEIGRGSWPPPLGPRLRHRGRPRAGALGVPIPGVPPCVLHGSIRSPEVADRPPRCG
jgi:hypothetical protein